MRCAAALLFAVLLWGGSSRSAQARDVTATFVTDPPGARVVLLVSGSHGGNYLGLSGRPLVLDLDRFERVGSFDVRFELKGFRPTVRNIKSHYFTTHRYFPPVGAVRLAPRSVAVAVRYFVAAHLLGLVLLAALGGGSVVWLVRWLGRARLAERELVRQEAEIRTLVERLIRAQESGRRELANELHDGLLQYVIAAGLHLENFREDLPRGVNEGELSIAVKRFEAAVEEGRRLIRNMRPPLLEDKGLAAAVRALVEETAREEGWDVRLQVEVPDGLPRSCEVALFRILQEALANARKHSRTRRLAVVLGMAGGALELSVRDWGVGFEGRPTSGHGLGSLRERAALVGGELTIRSRPGEGTTVSVRVPLSSPDRL